MLAFLANVTIWLHPVYFTSRFRQMSTRCVLMFYELIDTFSNRTVWNTHQLPPGNRQNGRRVNMLYLFPLKTKRVWVFHAVWKVLNENVQVLAPLTFVQCIINFADPSCSFPSVPSLSYPPPPPTQASIKSFTCQDRDGRIKLFHEQLVHVHTHQVITWQKEKRNGVRVHSIWIIDMLNSREELR